MSLFGCTTPYKTPEIEFSGAPGEKSFGGIRSYAAQSDLRVVWLHGMCQHKSNWAIKRNALVSRSVSHGTQTSGLSYSKVRQNEPDRFTFEHSVNGNSLEMRYLVWSPLTDPAKEAIKLDNNDNYTRADFNKGFKRGLINDCFSDAVVYSGTAGDPVRGWVRSEVCDALGGTYLSAGGCSFNENKPRRKTIFVAESLGSKILSDALISIWDLSTDSNKAQLKRRMTDVQMVFLLANQIPLLSAATYSNGSSALKSTEPSLSPLVEIFARVRSPEKGRSLTAGPTSQLKFVAFSDPNDLLSYPLLGGKHTPAGISIANVIVSNDTTYFGKIERPDTAHCGYILNPVVLGAIFDGYNGVSFTRREVGATNRCGIGG